MRNQSGQFSGFRLLSGVTTAIAAASAISSAAHAADFNGDGYDDQAIGMHAEDIGGFTNAGAVEVIYGGPNGLKALGSQFWHQNSAGIPSKADTLNEFGDSIAAGDFNGDGFDDLAIGAPRDDYGPSLRIKGLVYVLYGSSAGLTAAGNQLITTDIIGVDDEIVAVDGDGFGDILATGDFNSDGFDELVVGVPRATFNIDLSSMGVTYVIPGSAQGLRRTQAREWTQDSPGVLNVHEEYDYFGYAFAAGDFNDDGFDDLAIGSYEGFGAAVEAGAVSVLYGSAAGLTGGGDQLWYQSAPGISDSGEEADGFGTALAVGDFDGDGFDDLAVGVLDEDRAAPGSVTQLANCGMIHVLYGSEDGLTATGCQEFWQGTSGVVSNPEAGEEFGTSLSAGDFNGDGRDDLAIGVPGEKFNIGPNRGAVHVLYGTAFGLRTQNADFWHQDAPGIADVTENDNYFGYAVAAADFNGDGRDDLAISADGEQVTFLNDGAMHVLYGTGAGLTSMHSQFWHQNVAGIPDIAEPLDLFGGTLCQ